MAHRQRSQVLAWLVDAADMQTWWRGPPLRLALAEIGRPLPAFDLVLKRYWEAQHPGEHLEEYLHRGGLATRFGKALPQQLQSALGDVAQALLLPGTVGSVVGQVSGSLVSALRERRQTARSPAAGNSPTSSKSSPTWTRSPTTAPLGLGARSTSCRPGRGAGDPVDTT